MDSEVLMEETFLRQLFFGIEDLIDEKILKDSTILMKVGLGNAACLLDLYNVYRGFVVQYEHYDAYVPLDISPGSAEIKYDQPIDAFKKIDRNALQRHSQLHSGIIVPSWIADRSGLPRKKYNSKPDMALLL